MVWPPFRCTPEPSNNEPQEHNRAKVQGSCETDETKEKLDLNTLSINNENIPYAKVKNGEFDARFTRPAYYEFMKDLIREDDSFYIMSNEKKHLLRRIT